MSWQAMCQAGDRLFPWLLLSALLHLMLLLGVGFRPHPAPKQLPPQPIEVELSPAPVQGQLKEFSEPGGKMDAAPEGTELALDLPSGQERFLTADTRNSIHQQYLEVWRQQVERVGNLNYPSEARDRHLHGSLVLDVSLRPDGSLAGIAILRSSGIPLLDAAARRFVEMAAPFDPFPPELKGDTAVLHIIRTLNFRAGEVY